jgi:transcription-repair coupling factor (superfamily II helicase)
MTQTSTPIAGPLSLVDGPAPAPDDKAPARKTPPAAVAARLMEAWSQEAGEDLIFVAASERRADEIARALEAIAAAEGPVVLVFPPWDCMPYDRAAPSRESMGRRMAVLHHATAPGTAGRLVITSPEAMLQRTPPQSVAAVRFSLKVDEPLDREALEGFARRTGYMADEHVDEPGEIAMLAEVIDVYPPSALTPYRLVTDPDGMVADIKAFDPVTQRSLDSVASLTLTAASELVLAEAGDSDQADQDPHALARFYDAPLGTLFDAFPEARLLRDDDVEARLSRVWDQIAEAYESRRGFKEIDGAAAPTPERLYLSPAEAASALRAATALDLEGVSPTPGFATARSPGAALKHYIQDQQSQGRSVVLAGLAHEHRVMARLLKRNGLVPPAPSPSWNPLAENDSGGLTATRTPARA